jgi:hypothetical protein
MYVAASAKGWPGGVGADEHPFPILVDNTRLLMLSVYINLALPKGEV